VDLILVRHGVTDWNEQGRLMGRRPVGLNARGRAQASAAANALAGLPIGSILASPQRRAQETAAVIARRQGLEVQTETALDEVWVGRWQGKTFDELRGDPDIERYLADPTYVCDAIEPAASVHKRMVALIERLHQDAAGSMVLLVSHGDPLRLLIAALLSIKIDCYRRLDIAPASISRLRVRDFGARLSLLNWTPEGPSNPSS